MDKKNICGFCYGKYMESRYPNLKRQLQKNNSIFKMKLTDKELIDIADHIHTFNRHYIRFHSIGELYNIQHLENFLRISELLPDHIFGLWSKRKDLIRKIIDKPDNINIVYSNLKIDKPGELIPKNYDNIFNVITYDYAIKNKLIPNCSGLCIKCLKCYNEKGYRIIELIKSDQNRIKKGFLKPLEITT